MDIYAARRELKLGLKKIQDLHLRVVHYDRVSTEKEEQKSSIVNQNYYSEELIRSHPNWTYAGRYVDEATTGLSVQKRKGFSAMMDDAKRGKFDLIITKEVPRFARNTLDSIQWSRRLLEYGVAVWFINNNINTLEEDSEFMLTFMSGMAQEESRRISERVKFGQSQSIKRGHVMGANNMYGYIKENCSLSIDESTSEMIKYIFSRYASGEAGTRKIGKELFEKGFTNRYGNPIKSYTIQNIIKNPKYKGYYCGGKVVVEDMLTKKQRFIPEEDWICYKDDGTTVPAIVSEELWNRANEILKKRSADAHSNNRSTQKINLFTGKIICENDGASYWLMTNKNRAPYWGCSIKKVQGKEKCDSLSIKEEELIHIIKDIIHEDLGDLSSVVNQYFNDFKSLLSNTDSKKEIIRLENEIKKIHTKQDRLLEHNLNGYLDNEEYYSRDGILRNQKKELEAELKKIKIETSDYHINEIESKVQKHLNDICKIHDSTITKKTIDILFDKIYAKKTGERSMSLTFKLNIGYDIQKEYISSKNNTFRCDTMVNLMIAQRSKSFYRRKPIISGLPQGIDYNYQVVI